jgi:hypothetical protein
MVVLLPHRHRRVSLWKHRSAAAKCHTMVATPFVCPPLATENRSLHGTLDIHRGWGHPARHSYLILLRNVSLGVKSPIPVAIGYFVGVGLPCVGCIKKNLSDSGAICVPAGVSNIPPLSRKSVIKAESCYGKDDTIACRRAIAEFDRGTGCLEECMTESYRQQARTEQFCTNADICNLAAAPCNSKLVVRDVPPLTMASLPPLPKGIDADGALPLDPVGSRLTRTLECPVS